MNLCLLPAKYAIINGRTSIVVRKNRATKVAVEKSGAA
jgi:Fe2+ transport system protein FeoA